MTPIRVHAVDYRPVATALIPAAVSGAVSFLYPVFWGVMAIFQSALVLFSLTLVSGLTLAVSWWAVRPLVDRTTSVVRARWGVVLLLTLCTAAVFTVIAGIIVISTHTPGLFSFGAVPLGIALGVYLLVLCVTSLGTVTATPKRS